MTDDAEDQVIVEAMLEVALERQIRNLGADIVEEDLPRCFPVWPKKLGSN